MNKNIIIDGKKISLNDEPYIIAEISANHNGKIENAIKLINEAKKAGASAVKIQTYKPSTITLNSDSAEFIINKGLWKGKKLYDLYQEAHTPWEWHKHLFDYAKLIGITIFSSPFDNSAVDLLEELNAPAYKIASFEIIDLPLIKYVASTGKPIIISTGMANKNEIEEAIDTAYSNGCKQLALLRCVSGYPSPAEDYNLATIPHMREKFDVLVGLSDHTLDNVTAITSIAVGACIIEKHFTLSRQGGGPDDSFSLEPLGLKQLCSDSITAWKALGKVNYSIKDSEKDNIKFRRSLYFVKELHKGDIITNDSIKSVRPGYGEHPKYLDFFVGKSVNKDISINSPALLTDLER